MIIRTRLLKRLAIFSQEIDWEAVYTEFLPRVYNFFRYRVGDEALAEDLTAATFEKAWRSRQRYRSDRGAFSTWLFTIARRVAADYFRLRHDDLALEDATGLAGSLSPEETLQIQGDQARLSTLLAELPDRERELISLKYGAGLKNRAIAHQTGLTETNVGTCLNRAVQKLRAKWEIER